jgi:hypothetical protein
VTVNLVFKTGITSGIGGWLTLKNKGTAVRHDQTGPDQ